MNDFMRLALEETRNSVASGDGGPFGDVIVRKGEVIASVHNMVLKNGDTNERRNFQKFI